uniref:DUF4455 domain-containing protein n=1 Tax=Latimeria chalumnae TaxID=7897 RepID=H3B090_LATCH
RETKISAIEKNKETDEEIAAREVGSLTDIIVSEKTGSDIIQRVSQRRQKLHLEELMKLQKELADLSRDLEPLYLEGGETLLKKLLTSDEKVQQLFKKIESDSDLVTFTIQDLWKLWDDVIQQSLQRKEWIIELDEALKKLEWKRTKMVKDILKTYTLSLEKISFLVPCDVHRYIDKQAMMINQAFLANKRAVAKLYINLIEANLKWEKSLRLKWEDRVQDWKTIQRESFVQKLKETMISERVLKPESLRKEQGLMVQEQKLLNERREQLLQTISGLKPPTCSKKEVHEWWSSFQHLNEEIDSMHVKHMKQFRMLYENICLECLAEIDKLREELLFSQVCTLDEVNYLVNHKLLPLAGNLQRGIEEELDHMDKSLEKLAERTKLQSKFFNKFLQGAAHLWEVHEIGLAHQGSVLQEKLVKCRQLHDAANNVKEATLDMAIDKLRQESCEEELKNTLAYALSVLEDIRVGYEAFHQKEVYIVESFPDTIYTEIISYSRSVSRYFGVKEFVKQRIDSFALITYLVNISNNLYSRRLLSKQKKFKQQKCLVFISDLNPFRMDVSFIVWISSYKKIKKKKKKKNHFLPFFPTRRAPTNVMRFQTASKHQDFSPPPNKHSLLTAADKAHTYLKDILLPDNLLSTTRDRLVEICSSDTLMKLIENIFQTTSLVDSTCPVATGVRALKHTVIDFVEFHPKSIRLNFFEHLEDWYGTTLANCKNTVVAKKEELDAELKVLLHLHKPRAKRIEMDVHNVRAAELLLHKERVESHSKGVTEALNNLKKEFIILSTEQKNRSDDFCKKIQDMEAIFVNATKSDRLPALTDSLRTELEKHMGTIKTSLRLYRHNLGESLGKLRDSNAEFIKSFRLFSEGGNFSPEEVEMFRRRLEKLAGRIDVIEGFFMADVEGMESKCLEEATEVISKFEDKFTFLTIDLIFMEKIQRLLLHLQIKIKTEVTNSNSQAQKLNSSLEQFEKKIDACAHPNLDKETVTPEALYSFLKTVIDEVNKRCKYLNCLLEPTISITPLLEIVTASRSYLENMKQDSRVTFLDIETLMQPSRMGKPATDDVAVGVIKTIMQ